MIVEIILISIFVAFIRKGRLRNIENLEFSFWYLVIVGFVIQSIPATIYRFNNENLIDIVDGHGFIFVMVSYILIMIPLLFNIRKPGIFFVLSGTLLNAIVIFTNSFMMPVNQKAIKLTGYTGIINPGDELDFMHDVMGNDTLFRSLGDIIPLPKPYPIPQVISIGDVFICVGLFIFLQFMFVKKPQVLQEES